jgi:hypothetical protein
MPTIAEAWNAVKNFGREVAGSCYDLEWYRKVRSAPAPWRSVRYFLLLQALVVVVYAVTAGWLLRSVPEELAAAVEAGFPVGSYVEIKDGELTTGFAGRWESTAEGFDFVIDAALTGTELLGDLGGETVLAFGRDAVILRDHGATRSMRYDAEGKLYLSKEDALEWLRVSLPRWMLALGAVSTVAVYLVFLALNTSFVLLASWIGWGASRLAKAEMSYAAWLAMGFRLLTLPLLASLLAWLLGLSVPYLFSGLYFLVVLAIVMDERSNPMKPELINEQRG